jgi:hypothetical protein
MSRPSQKLLSLAILVVSCDNYSDLWRPFFMLFKRFWPDCPYSVYLLSNFQKTEVEGVVPVLVGEDYSWSDNLIKALNTIDEEYVLIVIDDLFMVNHPREERLNEVLDWIGTNNPNYVGLNSKPKPDSPFNDLVGIVSPGSLYRTSTVMAVWKKAVLLDLLKPGENAWEFEVYGSTRSDICEGFFSTWQELFPVDNGVIKGKWKRSAIKRLESLGVSLQLNKRKVMTAWETFTFTCAKIRNAGLQWFPARYRRRIKKIFSCGQCNYSLRK